MTETATVLVTGATGNIGGSLVDQLRQRNVDVRALVRDPDTARLPADVPAVRGDLTAPETLDAALDGVRSVFLLWPLFAVDTASAVVDRIAKHASRVVYLSAMAGDQGQRPDGAFGEIERLIELTDLQWTILRAGGLATNTLGWANQIQSDGLVRWPYADAGRSLVHEADVAAVAARALTEEGHHGAVYELTGPEVLTQREQVRQIGEVIGRDVHWEELDPDVARQHLVASWGDPGFAEKALEAWARMVDRPEPVTSDVEKVTGVPARTFREWAIDHADEFRGPGPQEIAERYVSLIREGKMSDALALMSANMVRVAPFETAEASGEVHGLDAIMARSHELTADYRIHHVEIDGPFVLGDRFAVRFSFEETHTPTGTPSTTTKMSLYTVVEGKIVREEVYYHDAPHAAAAF